MTQRLFSFGRVAALVLLGFGVGLSATPASAGGCGYGCGGGYGAYAYPSPYYGAYAAGWDGYGYDDAYVVAPRWGYRRHWGPRRWW